MDRLLEFSGVSYAYEEGREALKNLSVAIRKGEKIAVLGENGAGKSTFFLLCNGVLAPKSGEIRYNGEPVGKSRKDKMKLRQKVGIVFQEPDRQILAATVAEEISFGPLNLGLSREEAANRVEEALSRMNLTEYRDRPPHYLSGGEKKRVTIADILAMKPEILLFDEPASSLDPANAALLEQTLQTLGQEGMTLVIPTHDVNFAWKWAERALIFSQGELIADGPPETIFADHALLEKAGLKKPLLFEAGEILRQAHPQENIPIPRSIEQFREWAERTIS